MIVYNARNIHKKERKIFSTGFLLNWTTECRRSKGSIFGSAQNSSLMDQIFQNKTKYTELGRRECVQ